MNANHVLAVFVVAATAAIAQAKPPNANLSTRLHGAWLREMLDLDVKGAVADYEDIANDRSGRWERWVAVTRLAELRRVGIPMSSMAPVAEAPLEIRTALALLTKLPIPELLQQAAADTATARPANGAETPRLPDLWPATAQAQNWVRTQSSLSATERSRQRGRAAQSMRGRPEVTRSDISRIDWSNATEIVRREIDSRVRQADALREVWFADWQPPTVKEDGAVVLARVRANLDAWLAETTNPNQQVLLGRLRNEIEQRAATDVAAGLDLVRRLPLYSERLLAEPGKAEHAQPDRAR